MEQGGCPELSFKLAVNTNEVVLWSQDAFIVQAREMGPQATRLARQDGAAA